MPQHPGPLGWIEPQDRTAELNAAHDEAHAVMKAVNFALTPVRPAVGQKIMLTDAWKDPLVVADIGDEFTGFYQWSGSCVGVSDGNAEFTLGAVQRKLDVSPTVAFVPWWPYSYGKSRSRGGMRGQGEGSIDSAMGQSNIGDGILSAAEPGLLPFSKSDGWSIPKSAEFQWSDGGSTLVTKWDGTAKVHLLKSAAPIYDTDAMIAAIMNGYPILTGCSYYVGGGSIVHANDPAKAYARGRYDGRGGHSTCRIAVWNHPDDGMLIGYSNQWPASTYPKDPAGLARCCVWVPESEEKRMLTSLGGGDGETMALSHLDWFPAQPSVEQKFSWYI